ncbi:hypothetical protein ACFFQW_08385 [Umezawaea endophytica]|uniref:Uncharacterized protein n=1 Tax=Umezawaea endophytica TaxID=1654476 RepID=A0A9X2VH37_9PSEU|nr:hypothetical protein [Umezawaea endophytica]MCS7476002.1 hypothetical protein [Umezawaea endophytica]
MKQSGDHTSLLASVDGRVADVDALIVPTNRTPPYLRTVMGLARDVDSHLLVLCSGRADAGSTLRLAEDYGVEVTAIDVDHVRPDVLPSFRTTTMLASQRFERKTDTSLKRNLGLLFARSAGWDRVVFLDDDIRVPDPQDLARAAGLVDDYAGVGLEIGGFPDNSVVCHAYRAVGGFQNTFVGGGALAIGRRSMTSFFPNVYNEDWFFLLDDDGLLPTAVTGRAEQKPYDPFANELRARVEEFGDCLAEGVFALLDDGRPITDADARYWRDFLESRRELITDVLDKVELARRSPADTRLMVASLKAARGRCLTITPELCVDYLDALRQDRQVWRAFVEWHPAGDGSRAALTSLGLSAAAKVTVRRKAPALVR